MTTKESSALAADLKTLSDSLESKQPQDVVAAALEHFARQPVAAGAH